MVALAFESCLWHVWQCMAQSSSEHRRKCTCRIMRGAAACVHAAVSHRLLTALLMTLAPQTVEGREAGLVENMLVFSLVAGLTVGAMAGWLWLL